MRNITSHLGELKPVKRLKNSAYGNPQFLLQCNGYQFVTPRDSAHGYDVQNYFGKVVRVNIGRHYNKLTLHSLHKIDTSKFSDQNMIDMYLDYANNFLTVSGFSSHYCIDSDTAESIIIQGRRLHNASVNSDIKAVS